MLEILANCPVCGHSEFTDLLECQDYTVSQEKFKIVSCQNCNFKFTNPRPNASTIGSYYESEDYISHSDTNKGLINQAYKWVRSYMLRKKMNLINKRQQKGTLLDVGCGTGYFLETCQKAGWKVEGFEPDKNARKQAENRISHPIQEDLFSKNLTKNTFDVITLWHVLEHVHTLDETLIHLKSLLKKEGLLVIAVPNLESYDAQVFQEYWAAYDVPRHLYHFSQETLKTLMQKYQLEVKEIHPMPFDSYYASLLSSKYQTGKTQYLKAVSLGYKSNQKAKKNKNNYSSLIYFIRNTF